MTSNDDHIRKYDDWAIEPSTQPICPGAVNGVCPPDYQPSQDQQRDTQEAAHTPKQVSEQQTEEISLGGTNPFTAHTAQDPTVPHEPTSAPAPDVAPQQASETPVDDTAGDGPMIDPDTGLEIPDYMKPFVNRN